MCGICFTISTTPTLDPFMSELLDRRGPNVKSCHTGSLTPHLSYLARGSVLWMRGATATPQPVISEAGDVLLWNGNVFDGQTPPDGVSDTDHLAALLSAGPAAVLPTLAAVRGPFAFVLWQPAGRRLWFGRDALGRRSLLWDAAGPAGPGPSLTLSSLGGRHRPELAEVPSLGVFEVCVPADCRSCEVLQPRLHPWRHVRPPPERWPAGEDAPLNCPARLHVNPALPGDEQAAMFAEGGDMDRAALLPGMAAAVDDFEAAMLAAVRRRVTNMPAVCAECLARRTAAAGGGDRTPGGAVCPHAKLAVLFSGGVDSTLLAALADRCLPASEPVDLVNVAFERTTRTASGGGRSGTESRDFEVPDRVTGRQSWRELQQTSPDRQWNFVQVNVTAVELAQWRAARVRHLLSPLETVLDDSIGCAVWFAARGAGVLAEDGGGGDGGGGLRYHSRARVVLVGMGADEQLGGYGRHRSAFQQRSWPGLVAEMQSQLLAIGERNLGRDDRVISDHAREARFPFLDEAVVSLLSSLPVWLKAQPGWCGCDKLPVRLLAARCGAPAAARLAKRAIQFGSRIAKLENRAEKAADVCGRLAAATAGTAGTACGAEAEAVPSGGGCSGTAGAARTGDGRVLLVTACGAAEEDR